MPLTDLATLMKTYEKLTAVVKASSSGSGGTAIMRCKRHHAIKLGMDPPIFGFSHSAR